MCEYCYQHPHHPRCPEAPEPKTIGVCKQCETELTEYSECFTDNEDNLFCSERCTKDYYGIRTKEWD